MNENIPDLNRERTVTVQNGWAWLTIVLLLLFGGVALLIYSVNGGHHEPSASRMAYTALFMMILSIFLMPGFFALQPNEARVLLLFGKYKGTVRTSGFHWGNPFYSNGPKSNLWVNLKKDAQPSAELGRGHGSRNKISLRARNLNSEKLKVNDKRGNPIEIGAVVVWRVQDTAQAMFDVDDYESYVRIQSESAIRHLASAYAYDHVRGE